MLAMSFTAERGYVETSAFDLLQLFISSRGATNLSMMINQHLRFNMYILLHIFLVLQLNFVCCMFLSDYKWATICELSG